MTVITSPIRAPAKLTWTLRVTGVRGDGYHLIDAEMVTLDLHDTLRFEPLPSATPTELTVSGPFRRGVPADSRNLVVKALTLAGRTARVTIDKQIPNGGGLGGGSADAAAALRWAGYTDVAGAATIGADVGFCLVGGRARVRGIGELVEPLPHVERVVTLIVPPLHVSTPAVYRAWDALGGPTSDGPNDLEPAALVVEPRLAEWRDRIGEATGSAPILAGSGATWFVIGDHEPAIASLTAAGATVTVAHTQPGDT